MCLDASSELWEEEFFVSLGGEDKDDDDDDEDQESEEPSQEPPPQSKLNTYKEAISSLEDVQLFLENQGHVEESMQLGTLVDKLTMARKKLFMSSFSQTIIGERAKRARHSQVCSIENRGYIYYHILYIYSTCNFCSYNP